MGGKKREEGNFKKNCFIPWFKKNFPDSVLIVMSYTSKFYSDKGVPDIFLLCNGKSFFFELKVKNNKLSSEQMDKKHKIEKSGGYFFKVDKEWFNAEGKTKILAFIKDKVAC